MFFEMPDNGWGDPAKPSSNWCCQLRIWLDCSPGTPDAALVNALSHPDGGDVRIHHPDKTVTQYIVTKTKWRPGHASITVWCNADITSDEQARKTGRKNYSDIEEAKRILSIFFEHHPGCSDSFTVWDSRNHTHVTFEKP